MPRSACGDETVACRCFFTLESSNISTDFLRLGFVDSDDDDTHEDDDEAGEMADWGLSGGSTSQRVDEDGLLRLRRLLEDCISKGTALVKQ